MRNRDFLRLALGTSAIFVLGACGTTSGPAVSKRQLPPYEPPIAKSAFQTVRTTAYTHSEADHLAYGARNALGGQLHAASRPRRSASASLRALPAYQSGEQQNERVLNTDSDLLHFSMGAVTKSKTSKSPAKDSKSSKTKTKAKKAKPQPPQIGSAAADWSRWPAGTVFRVLSTGQTYKVDDYGWALAGRNTIDLYMASRSDMNEWGTRVEKIQVVKWGDRQESARLLAPRSDHRHIKRMLLQLEGREAEAAALD